MQPETEGAYAIQDKDGLLYKSYGVPMLFRTKKEAKPNVNDKESKIVKVELRIVEGHRS